MHTVLLRIGPLSIYSYGVMIALGFSLSTFLIYRRSSGFGLDKNKIIDLAILILVSGLAGARLLYVLLNLDYYAFNIIEIFNLSRGGLVWYGGFLGGLFISILYLKKNKINFWIFSDFVAPYIALAQSIGRIGCFLNGCCFGVEAGPRYPFGVVFPSSFISRHPTQIYSSLALLLVFIVLRLWQDRRRFASRNLSKYNVGFMRGFNGEIFLGYCILYGLKRFILEFLRADNPKFALNLTISQGLSVLIFFVSIIIFIYKAFEWKRNPSRLR